MNNGVVVVIYLAVIVFLIASIWKVYVKAGQPGWAAIIPIYNTVIQLRIVGRPWWWLLLMLIPLVNLVILVIVSLDMAKSFGRGGWFGVGLCFLPFIFYPILGFGSATYVGPRGAGSTGVTAEPTAAW
jgi:Family of unknown function (DUF5684)